MSSGRHLRGAPGTPLDQETDPDGQGCDRCCPQCSLTLTEMTCLGGRNKTTFYAYCPRQGDGTLIDLPGSARDLASLEQIKEQAHQRLSGRDDPEPTGE